MKELEELPAWWGKGISSSLSPSSSPSEDEGWKSNMQILLLSRNMEKEFARWRFDFKREEKYRSANQATLQMKSNEFRIIPFYSCNDIAITGSSNLLISQKVSQSDSGTRRNWNFCRRILMSNLGQHPIAHIQTIPDGHSGPKPADTLHTPHIQPKDPKTSKKSQRSPNEKRPSHT